MKRLLLTATLALAILPACATSFRGNAHISTSECSARCRGIGGEMAAYVFMGAYSTACVCEPPGQRADASEGVGAGGAVAGVWMQMQEQARQQQR
jgi:hypothetical protein